MAIKKYSRNMCNYFSIGIDGRIGLGFEKKRTNHQITNKIVYAWEGLKKMCCCLKTKKVKDVIDYVAKVDENGDEKILFSTTIDRRNPKVASTLSKNLNINRLLGGNPVCLVCTNINSIMGG